MRTEPLCIRSCKSFKAGEAVPEAAGRQRTLQVFSEKAGPAATTSAP